MSEGRRHGSIAAVLVAVAVALAACSAVRMPQVGSGAPAVGPASAFAMRSAPIRGADARFAFTSVTGAPTDLLRKLSTALNEEAKARKLNVVAETDASATYRVKGYLSAVGDRSGTVLVYVWDVVDARGLRLHRVSGQENGVQVLGDPWGGIRESTVRTAAKRTIDDLVAWSGAG
jgi:hypothetical protein